MSLYLFADSAYFSSLLVLIVTCNPEGIRMRTCCHVPSPSVRGSQAPCTCLSERLLDHALW